MGCLNRHAASQSIHTRSHEFSFPSFRSANHNASEESAITAYVHATLRHSASLPGIYAGPRAGSPATSVSSPESVPSGSSLPLSSASPTSCSFSNGDPFQNVSVAMPRSSSGSSTSASRTFRCLQPISRRPGSSSARLSLNTSEQIFGLPAPPRSRLSSQVHASSTPTTPEMVTTPSSDRQDPSKTHLLLFSDVLAATASSPLTAETEMTSQHSSFPRTLETHNPDLVTPAKKNVNRPFSTSAPMTLSNSDDTIIVREPKPPPPKRFGSAFPAKPNTDVQGKRQQETDIDEGGHRSYTVPMYRESSLALSQHGSDSSVAGGNGNIGYKLQLPRSHSDSDSRRPNLAPLTTAVQSSLSDAETEGTASSLSAGATTSHSSQPIGAGVGRPKQPKLSLHPIFPPGTVAEGWETDPRSPVLTLGATVSNQSPNQRQRTQSNLGVAGRPSTSPAASPTKGRPIPRSPQSFAPSGRRQQPWATINYEVPAKGRLDSPIIPPSPSEGNEDGAAARTLSKFERLKSPSSRPYSPLGPVRAQTPPQSPPVLKQPPARGPSASRSTPAPAPALAPAPAHGLAGMGPRTIAGSAAGRTGMGGTSAPLLHPPSQPPPRPPPPQTSNSATSILTLSQLKGVSHARVSPTVPTSPTTGVPSLDKHAADAARTNNDNVASLHPFAAAPTNNVDKWQNTHPIGKARKAPPVPAMGSAPGGRGARVGVVSSNVSVSTASGSGATIMPLNTLPVGSDSRIMRRVQSPRDEEWPIKKKDKRRLVDKLKLSKMFSGKSKHSSSSSVSISPTTPTYASTFSTLSSSSSSSPSGTNARATASAPAVTAEFAEREKKSSAPELGRFLTSRLSRASPHPQRSDVGRSEPKPMSDPGTAAGRQQSRRFVRNSRVTGPLVGFTMISSPTPGVQPWGLPASSAGPSVSAVLPDQESVTHSRMTPSSLLFGPKPQRNNTASDGNPTAARGLASPDPPTPRAAPFLRGRSAP